jgi:hypothetical protein
VFAELLRRFPTAEGNPVSWHTSASLFGTVVAALRLWPAMRPFSGWWQHLRSSDEFEPFLDGRDLEFSEYWIERGDLHRHLSDPMDLLDSLPAPSTFESLFESENAEGASLLDFLSAWLGDPTSAGSMDAFDVALFAAACVFQHARQRGGAVPSGDPERRRRVAWLQIAHSAENAMSWLNDQLPHRAFGPDVEAIIRSVGAQSSGYGSVHHRLTLEDR